MVKEKQLLKNYNKIWKKIERLMSIDFDKGSKKGSEKVPEDKIPHKCLSIITLDSVLFAYENITPKYF